MKLKKILLPFMSLAVIIAMILMLSGKSNPVIANNSKTVGYLTYKFVYTGPPYNLYGEYVNPNNYTFINQEEDIENYCEQGSDALCAIYCQRTWIGTGWKPDFSDTSWGSVAWQLDWYWTNGYAGGSLVLKAQ